MKRLLAFALTMAVLGSMIYVGSRGVAPTPPADLGEVEPAESPAEAAVRRLIRSGDEGDVPGYLDAFADSMRARLEREVATRGRDAFADDLRRAAMARKGHAVHAAEPEGDDAARVTVESVYPDRNERQNYRVVRSPDGWKVAEVATVRSHQPSARFGSPAVPPTPEANGPEGPPSPKVGLTVEAGDDPESQ